jgi:hypothetical protein
LKTYLQRMHARRGFPPNFSAGWKNASTSFVLSLSEMVGASSSESSDADGPDSAAFGADAVGFAAIHLTFRVKSELI